MPKPRRRRQSCLGISREQFNGTLDARSEFLSFTALGSEGASRNARLCRDVRSEARRTDAIAVVDADPSSATYSKIVGQVDMTAVGDELHHYGWNACSSCLCPNAPHPHVERRYLVVPGLRSSRIYIIDTKPDPRRPTIAKVIEPEEVIERTGYSRPHTVHCGPEGIYVSPSAMHRRRAWRHLPHGLRNLRGARPLGS